MRDILEFVRPKLTSEIDPADFHYVNKALKPIYFRNHLTNSSIAMVLSSRSMVLFGAALRAMRLAIHYYSYG